MENSNESTQIINNNIIKINYKKLYEQKNNIIDKLKKQLEHFLPIKLNKNKNKHEQTNKSKIIN